MSVPSNPFALLFLSFRLLKTEGTGLSFGVTGSGFSLITNEGLGVGLAELEKNVSRLLRALSIRLELSSYLIFITASSSS